ncbi:hypothetical protein I551_5405 [Mycobacterium ulcerans str. Harvey]|uniref:Uncharacterized protein n=1 Tax=Mycobacterium ulcerans str. Harvey TaxID=1299332 RepID=A0ABN0QUB2_MYCUL|nr:hypothetical protein I551_5405 [Mycobacterium ulcerans str. Harvey]
MRQLGIPTRLMLLQPTGHLLHVLLAERLGTRRIPAVTAAAMAAWSLCIWSTASNASATVSVREVSA